jgi:hypothetical protein
VTTRDVVFAHNNELLQGDSIANNAFGDVEHVIEGGNISNNIQQHYNIDIPAADQQNAQLHQLQHLQQQQLQELQRPILQNQNAQLQPLQQPVGARQQQLPKRSPRLASQERDVVRPLQPALQQ